MKKITFFLFLLFQVLLISAQKKKTDEPSYYVFNEKGEPCKIDDARYLGILEKLDDTAWQWKYYNFSGPVINIETYKDKEMTTSEGYFAFFDTKGKIDSSGYVVEGKKDKNWYYFDDSLHIIQTEEYEKGILLKRKTREDLKRERLSFTTDSIASKGEKEATYAGGETGWRKYLEKAMKIPERAMKLSKNGTAFFSFTVDIDGSLQDIFVIQSVEYSFDEAVRLSIKKSPKWEPAIQNGKAVKAYRKQPMTIRNN